jgi:hypothetical protein
MRRNEYNARRREFCARGSRLPHAKLTEDIVRDIRRNPRGLNGRQMAEAHGVSPTCIYEIWSGDTWSHVR